LFHWFLDFDISSLFAFKYSDREEMMLGSYGPQKDPHVWVSKPATQVPGGFMFRAQYNSTVKVIDDDGHEWLTFEQVYNIAKDW
jgi:hypothetical protein